MPKPNLKESITKIKTKLHRQKNTSTLNIKTKKPEKSSTNTEPSHHRKIQLPKLNLKSKNNQPQIPTAPAASTAAKTLPKDIKIIEKYPLYEPFAQVFIVQDPKTGEHKYVLDELQLDPMERGIYTRVLEMLLAEIESPKEEIKDPRKFFATEAKKIVDKYRISMGWLPDVSWYKILYYAERDLVGFG